MNMDNEDMKFLFLEIGYRKYGMLDDDFFNVVKYGVIMKVMLGIDLEVVQYVGKGGVFYLKVSMYGKYLSCVKNRMKDFGIQNKGSG